MGKKRSPEDILKQAIDEVIEWLEEMKQEQYQRGYEDCLTEEAKKNERT
jgi:hypothetical protein